MKERYIPDGKRLTYYEREILTILIEEANEVAQAACKLLRFGAADRDPSSGVPNNVTLAREIGDLNHMVGLVNFAGLISGDDIADGEERKARRLETYQQSEPPAPTRAPWWEVLQVSPDAGSATIRAAHRRRLLDCKGDDLRAALDAAMRDGVDEARVRA